MRHRIFMALLVVLVAGCAQTQIQDPSSRWYRMPVGAVVELKQALVLEPNHTRIFLQFGQIVSHGDMDRYYPSCNFEVRDKLPQEQTIAPDQFIVVRVEQGYDHIVSRGQELKVASWIWKEGPSPINRRLTHWLGSDKQPNVMRLVCHGGQSDWHVAELPTIDEIREALGDWVDLQF